MKSRSILIIGGLALLAFNATAALASEGGEGQGLNGVFSGNVGNAIWTLVIFLVVLGVLSKFAWGPILAGLQRREQFIRESLETAKRDREAAEARLREYEQRLVAAREEASQIVEEGRRDGEATRRKIEEDARAAGEAMIERAKREIGVARDTVLRDLYDRSADLATNLAGKILQRQVSADDHSRLVQEAMADLQSRPGQETRA